MVYNRNIINSRIGRIYFNNQIYIITLKVTINTGRSLRSALFLCTEKGRMNMEDFLRELVEELQRCLDGTGDKYFIDLHDTCKNNE